MKRIPVIVALLVFPISVFSIYQKISLIKFSVVKINPFYKIYRSKILGKKGLEILREGLAYKRLPFPKTILHLDHRGLKGHGEYSSGLALEEFDQQEKYHFEFIHPFVVGARTYLDPIDPYHPSIDIDQQKYFGKKASESIPVFPDKGKDGGVVSFFNILDVVLDTARQPVLIHDFNGQNATGMISLALRYIQGGDWVHGDKKLVTIPKSGQKVELNPAQYEYYRHNKWKFEKKNLEFIEKVSKTGQFEDLINRFRDDLNSN
ncbi:MAG: hypothetical protein HOE90_21855 [Bacteriovoracaceae bacterium]|jgi:hypothetical protein|nr:hypothetical protein [Bacteriovoracaceae bacterium]